MITPEPRRNAQLSLDPQRKLEGGRPAPIDELADVRLTQPHFRQRSMEVEGQRFMGGLHGSKYLHFANISTSLDCCSLREALLGGLLQTANMDEVDRKAGNNLRAWREFRRMSQAELAEQAGTTASVISLLESGDRKLSPKWLNRLAPPLHTTPGYMLDHDPNDLATNVLEVWASIPTEDRAQALKVIEAFRKIA